MFVVNRNPGGTSYAYAGKTGSGKGLHNRIEEHKDGPGNRDPESLSEIDRIIYEAQGDPSVTVRSVAVLKSNSNVNRDEDPILWWH